ncbi:hypothetical protein C2E23DRAFT_505661 [Lenzites betulinus]|nr:hypothetical protein C2E23DRAFT_505661 [Lenzites betulinus]
MAESYCALPPSPPPLLQSRNLTHACPLELPRALLERALLQGARRRRGGRAEARPHARGGRAPLGLAPHPLRREHGDAVLIGASSVAHIEQNLKDLEKGPLREWSSLKGLIVMLIMGFVADEVVKALDDAWLAVMPYSSAYFH